MSALWSFSAADLPLQRHRLKHHDSHCRWAPTCMPRRHPSDGTDWNTLDDGCPSPREATSTYFAPKAQDYVPSACSTRIADDKRLSKPRQGAELCTLGTQCPRLCKQYRVRDKHSLPNPRRRRTSAHPQHEILSPGRHHIGAQPLPKAQACAPSVQLTPPRKAAEAHNPRPRHKLVYPRHELPSP